MSVLIELLKSIAYGIIQGITEWLPISSTGHLILLNTVIPLHIYEDVSANVAFWNLYKVAIQLGSIMAVVVLYWNKLWPFSKAIAPRKQKQILRLWANIIIASIPVGILGILLNDYIDETLSTPVVVAVTLIAYGIIFILVERRTIPSSMNSLSEISPKNAFFTGLFESLALVPGTSRSGATIIGGRMLGMNRSTAAEFSFFLAIPAMLGASLLKLFKIRASISVLGALVLVSGMAVSFLVSIVVIRSLLYYIRRNSFRLFGAYRIILGILILILALLGAIPEGVNI